MHESYRCEYIRCGKASCGKCPHGPYWYGYFRADGRLKKKYYGRARPAACQAAKEKADWREAIFTRSTASAELAWKILGLPGGNTKTEAKKRFRDLTYKYHPDRGCTTDDYRYITCAWNYLCKLFEW